MGSTTVKQAHRQASRCHGSTAVLLQREPTHEVERILMLDFTTTQAQAKEVAPPASREGGQDEAAVAMPLSASPPLTTDEVDKMYDQLGEIHAIATAQLAEYAHWHKSD
jgi:hypothetical protein